MWILAIDTSAEVGSIALAQGARFIEEVTLRAPSGVGDVLFVEIDALLARHGVKAREIGCFAGTAGPGTFTGVRAALAAVKGFAEATGAKAVAISTLQSAAWFGSAALRAPYRNAHRGEVYAGLYDAQMRPLREEMATKFEPWAAELPPGAELIPNERPLARAVAAIAWDRIQAEVTQDPADIDANYVRRADAELTWTDR